MATLNWVLTMFGPMVLAALVSYVTKQQEDERANSDAKDAGAAQATATVNRETANAERRASDASINMARGAALDNLLLGGRQI